MEQLLEETQALESTTVGIYRTATVVKGGRRFSFAALVVVGDRNGSIGVGYGKAPGVPAAIEKAQKEARKKVFKVVLNRGTLPHPVTGAFSATQVRLLPASPGTGVIAGGTVRAVLEMAGVRDCLTKAYGSTNQKNLCKAVIEGLQRLQHKDQIATMRGVTIETSVVDEVLAAGEKYAPAQSTTEKAAGPVNIHRDNSKKGGGRGRGRRRGAPRGGPRDGAPTQAGVPAKTSTASAAQADQPAVSPEPSATETKDES